MSVGNNAIFISVSYQGRGNGKRTKKSSGINKKKKKETALDNSKKLSNNDKDKQSPLSNATRDYMSEMAVWATKEIINSTVSIGVNCLQRVGEYTGNTITQANIDNIQTALSLTKSFISSPIQTSIDLAFKYSDFNLQKYKDNLEAQYQSYLLNDIKE